MDNEKLNAEEVFPEGPRHPDVPENFFTLITTFRDQLYGRSSFRAEDLGIHTKLAILCLEEAIESIRSTNVFYDGFTIANMNTLSKGKHMTTEEIQNEIDSYSKEVDEYSKELDTIYAEGSPYENLRNQHYQLLAKKSALHEVIVMNLAGGIKSKGEEAEEELLNEKIIELEVLINREIELRQKRKHTQKIIKGHKEILKVRKIYGNWQDALKRYWDLEKELYILWCKKMLDKGYWYDYMQLAFDKGYLD